MAKKSQYPEERAGPAPTQETANTHTQSGPVNVLDQGRPPAPQESNEILVISLNGAKMQVTRREMQGQFRHPLFVSLVLGMVLLVILLSPFTDLVRLGPLEMTLFYGAGAGSFVLGLYAIMTLFHRMGWPDRTVLTVGFAALCATAGGLAMARILGAPAPTWTEVVQVAAFVMFFSYLGEIIFSVFLMPKMLADMRRKPVEEVRAQMILPQEPSLAFAVAPADPQAAAEPPPLAESKPVPPPAMTVRLFGQNFPIARITALEAEEHYVVIHLRDGAPQILRGRIGDAVTTMPEGVGRQVHRSHWVAAAAVVKGQSENGQLVILLADGRKVPVARSRQAEVRDWLRQIAPQP